MSGLESAVADLKPYPAYKDTDLPWLDRIPEHWEVRRGKTLLRCIDIRSESGEEELLTVSSERGVIPRSTANVTMFKAESYAGYKLCWPGDLVINSLWAWGRGLGVTRNHGIVSSAYGVYRLRPAYERYADYIHELVRSNPFQWELQVRSKGVWVSRLQLTDDAFLTAPILIPPEEDRQSIVRFLSQIDRQIRQYIRAKQKLIKLLEEQKQAIIQHAVTRGLDPKVRLKPSGVAWLGDVPEHWEVRRIASFCPIITNGWVGPTRDILVEAGVPYIQSLHVKSGRIKFHRRYFVEPAWLKAHQKIRLLSGDVVVVQTGDIGQVACIPGEFEGAGCHALIILRTNPQIMLGQYLDLVLRSSYGHRCLKWLQTGALHPHLNCTWVREISVPIPSLAEQHEIVDSIKEGTEDLDSSIENLEEAIDLLGDFRIRLVADVVTGKLDVRDIASELPEEAQELVQFEGTRERDRLDKAPDEEDSDVQPEEAES